MWEFMFNKFKIEEFLESKLHVVVLVSSSRSNFRFFNFHSIIVDLFTLRIAKLNPPQVFYLETVGFIGFPG